MDLHDESIEWFLYYGKIGRYGFKLSKLYSYTQLKIQSITLNFALIQLIYYFL